MTRHVWEQLDDSIWEKSNIKMTAVLGSGLIRPWLSFCAGPTAFLWVLPSLRHRTSGQGHHPLVRRPLRERAGQLVLQRMWQPIRANAKLIYFSSQLNLYLSPGLSLQGPEFFKCLVERRFKKTTLSMTYPFHLLEGGESGGGGVSSQGPFVASASTGQSTSTCNLPISSITCPTRRHMPGLHLWVQTRRTVGRTVKWLPSWTRGVSRASFPP